MHVPLTLPTQGHAPPGDALPRPFGNCYWLWLGHVLAGEHPGSDRQVALEVRLHQLAASGITTFVNLTRPEDPVPPYMPHAVNGRPGIQWHFPVPDFGVPDHQQLTDILATIDTAVTAGERVYLHCRAGIGRTGTVAACWLVKHGLDADQALAALAHKWQVVDKSASEPHTPETSEQVQCVHAWARHLARANQRLAAP